MIQTAINYKLPVFPVKGKIPAVKDWQKLASSDPKKIAELFTVNFTGIGLVTGAISGITVIDIDVKNGVNGFQTLKNLGIEIPATVCVLTPSGGRQYYFQYDPDIKNMVSAGGKNSGIDIRNDGGLVIMPKSVHPNGGIYEFQIEQGLGEIELAKIPAELKDILVDKGEIKKNFELPNEILDGSRNATLYKYACSLRATGSEKQEILTSLYTINKERCKPPYAVDKLEIIAESACTHPKGLKPIPADEVIFSDIYNAGIFKEFYGERIKWCRDLGGWWFFDGKSWICDKSESIKRFGIEISKVIDERMRKAGNKARGNLNRINSNQGIDSMLNCSKALLGCSTDDFDNDKYLFNCLNGTYDLDRNIHREFYAKDMITKCANVSYDIHAECPLWMSFLNEIFSEKQEVIRYIQRIMGYSLTASTKEQCMFIFYGHGRNGKNVLVETIRNILGNYALNCPSSMLMQKANPGIPNDLARLKGIRFATASETNQNVNFDEELIKQLTGDKTVTARFLGKEWFDFEATFKIILSTNHKPNIRGTDPGIWRKIQMIPFSFTVEEGKEDKDLPLKFMKEYSGIFNWMIEGHNDWRKNGLGTPKEVKDATNTYREEEDDLGQFIGSECIIDKTGFIPSQEFRERFKHIMGYPKGTKSLNEYMQRHGYHGTGDNRIYINGKQKRGYYGIRWATDMDRMENKGWSE